MAEPKAPGFWTCQACGGTYSDICTDGLPYYHVCPPAGFDELGVPVPRVNARDERIDPLTKRIRAEGAGRIPRTAQEVRDLRLAKLAAVQRGPIETPAEQDAAASDAAPAERRRKSK